MWRTQVKEVVYEDTHPMEMRDILHTELTPALKREGMMREVIRAVQNARKEADLQVDDRIHLSLKTDDKELNKAVEEHLSTIEAETLGVAGKVINGFVKTVKVEGIELTISLKKS